MDKANRKASDGFCLRAFCYNQVYLCKKFWFGEGCEGLYILSRCSENCRRADLFFPERLGEGRFLGAVSLSSLT